MTAPLASKLPFFKAPFTFVLATFCIIYSWQLPAGLAELPPSRQPVALSSNEAIGRNVPNLARSENNTSSSFPGTLDALLDAINVMQEKYFDITTGAWPESIDWTAAVFGTHVSATLSTLISSIDQSVSTTCTEILAWDNLINRYFSHTSIFYFGENALSIRQQAYDDMLWVVLGWLENIKFIDLYSSMRSDQADIDPLLQKPWHGMQFRAAAAHRARVFYNIAVRGWDTSLCNGGMVWNQHLRPYKNSITNELFISASISMYLYFPGDDNDSPFYTTNKHQTLESEAPHNPAHLQNAIRAYAWLKSSNMTNPTNPGLYADGYHISGWHRTPDGRINPGTGKCDDLNTMVYTYNQGVVLTGLRGLYLATGERSYLADGHALIESVLAATGWPDTEDVAWSGLGGGGILEEYCDRGGYCSQDGQTFKGIFFGHLAEFCRDLSVVEETIVSDISDKESKHGRGSSAASDQIWQYHLYRCKRYHEWVEHNAYAAAITRDEEGRFGMWWGRAYPDDGTAVEESEIQSPPLPAGAVDYANDEDAHAAERSGASASAAREVRTAVSGLDGVSGRRDLNNRGRGRTVETQNGGVAVLRALWQWESVLGRTGTQGQDVDWLGEL